MAEQYVTLAEVRDMLNAEADARSLENRELLPSQKAAKTHANAVCLLTQEDAKAMVDELMKLEFITDPAVAYKIADLRPKYSNDVRAIFQKERNVNLDADMIQSVLDIVSKY